MSRTPPRAFTSKSGRAITIRCAELADAQTMLDLAADGFATGGEFFITQADEFHNDLAKERDWIQAALDSPADITLLALDGEQAVGMINFRVGNRRRIAHRGEFGMNVHSDYRDDGIGAALLRTLLDWAVAHPTVEKVTLGVYANNPRAIALYRKMGFIEESRRIREFKLADGTYADDVLMGIWVKNV